MTNPFEFKYPDDINPRDVIDLFVPVFGEYYNIPKSGHTFINGARGSGKSMMFRYMKPDCQVLVDDAGNVLSNERTIKEIDYFGIYIPIKKGHINITDIKLNDKHGEALLNEHYMVIHFSLFVFNEFLNTHFEDNDENRNALVCFYNKIFCKHLRYAGFTKEVNVGENTKIRDVFESAIEVLRQINSEFQHGYIKKLIGAVEPLPYNGILLLYSEFLFEILKELRKLPFMPDKPIYLLIDDADELNITQRMILNSWVSMRTTNEVSLKISTQLKYKVYKTINDSRIDTPHDYSEVNINDVYTTQRDLYYKRVSDIVTKRLIKCGFGNTVPEMFFPEDLEQSKKLEALREEYVERKKKEGLTDKQSYDYAYRYVVPDFIKSLEGNRYTYNYAGFKQLVNVSSGIIREFIDFASEMYVGQKSENNNEIVCFITHTIQDREIKKVSTKKMESEFDKYRDESPDKGDMDKLRNLINGMGGLFRTIIVSDASERRVFSIALNDEPDEDLKKILELGIQHGYLQKSMIGNKYGTGKARLYILNRLLAPFFGLDPSSFAGYKFMNSDDLKKTLTNPEAFIKYINRKLQSNKNANQTSLFDTI